jgi:hypothetical protein
MKSNDALKLAFLITSVGFISAPSIAVAVSATVIKLATLPSSTTTSGASKANINVITQNPPIAGSSKNGWLTVADGRGPIYFVNPTGGQTSLIVDLNKTGLPLELGRGGTAGNSESGVRGFAYHPDFGTSGKPGYLKVYTMSTHPTSTRKLPGAITLNHGAPAGAPQIGDNVLTEWKMKSSANLTVDPASRREVLRFPQLFSNHGTDALVFNPNTTLKTPNTKLLYIAAGDGGSQGDPYNLASNGKYLYGKILRIDPLKPGSVASTGMIKHTSGAWSFPISNPGANNPDRDAYYVKGMRHPETMFINGSNMIIADIGGDKVEEVNILKLNGDQGKSFGWKGSEGRSPVNTATIPPVTSYSHAGAARTAIIVGGVPTNNSMGPALNGKVILGDLVSGNVMWTESPSTLEVARSWSKPQVLLNPLALKNAAGNVTTLLKECGNQVKGRVDLRMASVAGTVYGTCKQQGTLFKFAPG